jgi:hypothetical protein
MARLIGRSDLPPEEREAILLDALGGDPSRSRDLLARMNEPGDVLIGGETAYGTSIFGRPNVQLHTAGVAASVFTPRWTLLWWVSERPRVITRSDASSTAAPSFSIS